MRSSVCIMNEIVNLNRQVQDINSKLVGDFSIQRMREHCQYWDGVEQKTGRNAELCWRITFEAFERSGFSSGNTTKVFKIDGIDNDNLVSSEQVSRVLGSLAEYLGVEKVRRLRRIDELILELKGALKREEIVLREILRLISHS